MIGKISRDRVADQILDDLRSQILSGKLPHGTKLPAERDLAIQYGVSGPTIREATRALTAMGLVSARHGSGCYVTARSDTLVAMSLASVLQLENVGAADVLGVLDVLTVYAVELAVDRISDDEVLALRKAVEEFSVMVSEDEVVANVRNFLRLLVAASHNPLLISLCKFFVDLQLEISVELFRGEPATWKKSASMNPERRSIVEALARRDANAATKSVRAYHQAAIKMMGTASRNKKRNASNPAPSQLVSSLLENSVNDSPREARTGHYRLQRAPRERRRVETTGTSGSRR